MYFFSKQILLKHRCEVSTIYAQNYMMSKSILLLIHLSFLGGLNDSIHWEPIHLYHNATKFYSTGLAYVYKTINYVSAWLLIGFN